MGFAVLLFSTSLVGALNRAGVLEVGLPELSHPGLASQDQALERKSGVLAATDIPKNITFKVNVPSVLADTLTVEGEAKFNSNISTDNKDINLGSGKLTAGNIIYSLTAGTGVSISSGQSPKITNTGVISLGSKTGDLKLEAGDGITVDGLKITNADTGSSLKVFKTITVGSSSFDAGNSKDTITFAAG